jgi:MFS family permease
MVMKVSSHILNPYKGLKREVYLIFISKTINAMGFLIIPFMALLLSTKVGLSNADTGFYVAVSGLMWAPAALIGGRLSDSIGRKKVLITGELLATAAYLVCFFLEPGMSMVYMLMAASFFFGVAGPSHDALTADLTSPEQREGAYSLNYLGFNLGFAFAQILAGFLFQNHLKIMFLIDALTALSGLMLIAFLVKEPERGNLSQERGGKNSDSESGSNRTVLAILWAKPILLVFALTICGYRFLYSQWPFLIPLHLEHNFPKEGARIFGFLGSFNALIVVVLIPVLTALLHHKSHVRKVFYAGLLFTFGFGMLGFVSMKAAFFVSVLVITLGEVLDAISVMPFIMNHSPSTHRGRMSAILPIIMGTGFYLGPVIMGSVLDHSGFRFTWFLAAVVGVVMTLIMKGIDVADGAGNG